MSANAAPAPTTTRAAAKNCARCFTGSEASSLTTRASVNAASVPASKIRVTVRSMAVVPRTQARSSSRSARDFVGAPPGDLTRFYPLLAAVAEAASKVRL